MPWPGSWTPCPGPGHLQPGFLSQHPPHSPSSRGHCPDLAGHQALFWHVCEQGDGGSGRPTDKTAKCEANHQCKVDYLLLFQKVVILKRWCFVLLGGIFFYCLPPHNYSLLGCKRQRLRAGLQDRVYGQGWETCGGLGRVGGLETRHKSRPSEVDCKCLRLRMEGLGNLQKFRYWPLET